MSERSEGTKVGSVVVWPSQCSCGHLFLERYTLKEPNDKGEVGFCWCGFCRTKRMVRPHNSELAISRPPNAGGEGGKALQGGKAGE